MAHHVPQASNGTTVGQLLAAGPQSVLTTAGQSAEPEGAVRGARIWRSHSTSPLLSLLAMTRRRYSHQVHGFGFTKAA